MRAFTLPMIAVLALGAAAPAFAATTLAAKAPAAKPAGAAVDTGVIGDVRCLLTMTALANNKERQQAAQAGVFFFAGRISTHPGFDLTAAVKAQAPTMGPPQLQAELQRCGPMVATAAQNTQAAINSLRPPGAPAPAAPAPAAPLPAPK